MIIVLRQTPILTGNADGDATDSVFQTTGLRIGRSRDFRIGLIAKDEQMSGKNRSRDLYDVLTGWVEEIRATGGVSDCGYETIEAISAATKLCWAIHYENGYDHNEMTPLGIKWVAAFTVSCAKHGTGDLRAICAHGGDRQAVFRAEAGKNRGMVEAILTEAAKVDDRLFESAMAGIMINLEISSSEY